MQSVSLCWEGGVVVREDGCSGWYSNWGIL